MARLLVAFYEKVRAAARESAAHRTTASVSDAV
jgi:hypothetical protein